MLQSLHIKNIALIDEIEVEFKNGLNILTGETGAGKSIILGAITLALGGKFSRNMLRDEEKSALVELFFYIEDEKLREELTDKGVFFEDETLVISRRFVHGKSTNRINGETVPITNIRDIANLVINIHGQHEHESLLHKKNYLGYIDLVGGDKIAKLKLDVKEKYNEYRAIRKKIEAIDSDEYTREKELSFLKFEVDEIEKAELVPGEDEELEEKFTLMRNSKKIVDSVSEAYGIFSSDNGLSDLVGNAVHLLNSVSSYDDKAREIAEQVSEIEALVSDSSYTLSDYINSLEFSDEDFDIAEERLNQINELKRKYGKTIELIIASQTDRLERIQVLSDYDKYVEGLNKEEKIIKEQYFDRAMALSVARKKTGKELEKNLLRGIKELNFENVEFKIDFTTREEILPGGVDEVDFLISLNEGYRLRPLNQVASGGELSRIMLALKAAIADKDQIETLIFDEIDTGISGRTAQTVSEKMSEIARNHQVICITHLASIASMADAHFIIEKHKSVSGVITDIRELSDEEIIDELARILGGAKITKTVMDNAREMKKLANSIKEQKNI
ncbi:MAG: DNA repair protein RecN [Lachnospiraceae bacterium]|jgi:DNA repair protein RecN (Recombination protein N)|nr:DNA repair protein RecN [Lachnospiraceae bacterium]